MCEYSVVASGPWLFDVCISPAVMTVAAAGWVSGELIISVCHLWRGWSCDTGSSHTASLFWCGHWRCMCMCVYTCLCEESTWSALHITEGARHTHTHTHTNTHINTERGAAVTCAVHSVCWCINLHCALHFLPCVFRRCESGIKHLSAVTVATPLVWGMNTRGEGGERERVRRREMASREIEQNERRQEARWRDDQIKTCGSLHRCPKGSHLSSPPLSPHGPEAT